MTDCESKHSAVSDINNAEVLALELQGFLDYEVGVQVDKYKLLMETLKSCQLDLDRFVKTVHPKSRRSFHVTVKNLDSLPVMAQAVLARADREIHSLLLARSLNAKNLAEQSVSQFRQRLPDALREVVSSHFRTEIPAGVLQTALDRSLGNFDRSTVNQLSPAKSRCGCDSGSK
jgi:hypothetical protein